MLTWWEWKYHVHLYTYMDELARLAKHCNSLLSFFSNMHACKARERERLRSSD